MRNPSNTARKLGGAVNRVDSGTLHLFLLQAHKSRPLPAQSTGRIYHDGPHSIVMSVIRYRGGFTETTNLMKIWLKCDLTLLTSNWLKTDSLCRKFDLFPTYLLKLWFISNISAGNLTCFQHRGSSWGVEVYMCVGNIKHFQHICGKFQGFPTYASETSRIFDTASQFQVSLKSVGSSRI